MASDKHRRALAHLRRKERDRAHEIVMGMRDKLAFRIHALVHRIEGDMENARYWYDRAGVPFIKTKGFTAELIEVESAVNGARRLRVEHSRRRAIPVRARGQRLRG